MSATDNVNTWLAAWGAAHNTVLSLNNGVCAIFKDKQEAAVIELPAESESLLFHCRIETLHENVKTTEWYLRMLLALNFEMDAMRGCWLALDDKDNLRLCTQVELTILNKQTFINMLEGFMNQVTDVVEFLAEVQSASA